MKYSVPSKTFLFGEYGVLKNSAAALVNTTPRFELLVNHAKEGVGKLAGISSECPAGRYYQVHQEFFSRYNITFVDPWQGSGGFGASSAQFVMLYAFRHQLTANDLHTANYDFLNQFRNTFREMSWKGIGLPPSGADVLSQWIGGITELNFSDNIVQKLGWNFSEISFVLIKTDNKVATHLHLEDIQDLMDQEYALIAQRGIKAIQEADEKNFILAVQAQYQLLSRNELVSNQTRELIEKIKTSGFVLTAKGCGAMGADVVFLVTKKEDQKNFITWARKNNLNVVGTQENISRGLEITEVQSENMASISPI